LCGDDGSDAFMCRIRLMAYEELVRMTYAETRQYLHAEGHLGRENSPVDHYGEDRSTMSVLARLKRDDPELVAILDADADSVAPQAITPL
jgi:hypothetical protein